jgi:trans-2,3-dihydro-3-hydroxyanthranilate isomerase
MQHRYVLVDVFTQEPLAGNALAVFTDARGLSSEQMQRVAREMNLSETVFVLPAEAGGDARVRIFTPRTELPFAGHPIVGASWVIGRAVHLGLLRLETGLGVIPVELERDGGMLARVTMTQQVPTFEEAADSAAYTSALGLPAVPVVHCRNGPLTALVRAPSRAVLSGLTPDLGALERCESDTVCVFALEDGEMRVRVFCPRVGVPEDPGTGSAAGPLVAHLVNEGDLPGGPIVLHQGAEMGRPCQIEVDVVAGGAPRVGGACAVLGRGALEL